MTYIEFRDRIRQHLRRTPGGATWAELRDGLRLPYDRPCPTWVACLEKEIGLRRATRRGRALVWTIEESAARSG